jgi:hypothetical protein
VVRCGAVVQTEPPPPTPSSKPKSTNEKKQDKGKRKQRHRDNGGGDESNSDDGRRNRKGGHGSDEVATAETLHDTPSASTSKTTYKDGLSPDELERMESLRNLRAV